MTSNKRRTIKSTLARLGMQTKPERVVETLGNYGVEVSEKFVARVKMQILQDDAKAMREKSKRPPKNKTRKRPQQRKIPYRG